MKKSILGILIFSTLFILFTGCENKKSFTTIITNFNEITYITADTYSEYSNIKVIADKDQMKEIYNTFYNKTTKLDSIYDTPANPDELYLVTFKDNASNSTSAYIYKRKNNYYIEQPYNGIYEIKEDEYNKIKNIIVTCDNTGAESKITINDKNVSMTIKKNSLTNRGATLILSNLTDNLYSYGNPYFIEKEKDGKWYKLYPIEQLYFTLPAYGLKAKQKVELEINWKYGYGTLSPGTYRLIKTLNRSTGIAEKDVDVYVAAEFTIEE